MKIGCLNKNNNVVEYIYYSNRIKNLPRPYGTEPYVQFEMEEGKGNEAYSWDSEQNEVVLDETWTAPQKNYSEQNFLDTLNNVTYSFNFTEQASARNEWLEYLGDNKNSDEVSAINLFNSRLLGITFSNSNNDVDCDIELYVNGDQLSNKVLTWEIRNSKYAYISKNLNELEFSSGDRISVYIRNQGGNASDVVVTLLIIGTTLESKEEYINFDNNGNISISLEV